MSEASRLRSERTKCYHEVGKKIPEVPFKLKCAQKAAQWKICVENLEFFSSNTCFLSLLHKFSLLKKTKLLFLLLFPVIIIL